MVPGQIDQTSSPKIVEGHLASFDFTHPKQVTLNILELQVQPVLYGCFNWMIQNLYMGNGWKSPNIH